MGLFSKKEKQNPLFTKEDVENVHEFYRTQIAEIIAKSAIIDVECRNVVASEHSKEVSKMFNAAQEMKVTAFEKGRLQGISEMIQQNKLIYNKAQGFGTAYKVGVDDHNDLVQVKEALERK